jgi:cell division protease FtsH
MSASEFVEAIVGVGAARVRDLFRQAKADAPSIIFIDELDAIGRARSSHSGVGSEEREQTLNQILTEMDGFDALTDVIVVGATNRIDVLDPALLRPGRFDRRVVVRLPDRRGRLLILRVHAAKVLLADGVDLDDLAARTAGMAGADLANLVNEAALIAARRANERVEPADFDTALEKVLLGTESRIVLGDVDRRRIAYHEAGHALVGMLTPGADRVRKVSIIPRGGALGVTMSRPDADRFNYTRDELEAGLRVLLGGRAAELLAFGEATTGAEVDLAQLTGIARRMVGRWGMSERLGLVSVVDRDGFPEPSAAPDTQALVDSEVRRVVEKAYEDVEVLLAGERPRLDDLANALLRLETLDGDEAYAVAGVEAPAIPEPVPGPI